MDDVGIEVARRINVSENDWESFGGAELLGSYVGHSETVAAGRSRRQVDCVRDLEVVAQALIDHQLRSLEKHWHYVWKGEKIRRLESIGSIIALKISERRDELPPRVTYPCTFCATPP